MSGENVAPTQVEAVLLRHVGVAEACVYGLQSDLGEDVVVAAVVPVIDVDFDLAELRAGRVGAPLFRRAALSLGGRLAPQDRDLKGSQVATCRAGADRGALGRRSPAAVRCAQGAVRTPPVAMSASHV